MIDKGKIIAEDSKENLMNKCSNLPTSLEVVTQGGMFVDSLNNILIKKIDNVYTLRLDNNDGLVDILNTLKNGNVVVENVNIKRPSLEEVFIHLIRG
jgi:ABC-type multidrug transport system ATPase subunit